MMAAAALRRGIFTRRPGWRAPELGTRLGSASTRRSTSVEKLWGLGGKVGDIFLVAAPQSELQFDRHGRVHRGMREITLRQRWASHGGGRVVRSRGRLPTTTPEGDVVTSARVRTTTPHIPGASDSSWVARFAHLVLSVAGRFGRAGLCAISVRCLPPLCRMYSECTQHSRKLSPLPNGRCGYLCRSAPYATDTQRQSSMRG